MIKAELKCCISIERRWNRNEVSRVINYGLPLPFTATLGSRQRSPDPIDTCGAWRNDRGIGAPELSMGWVGLDWVTKKGPMNNSAVPRGQS